MRAAGVKIIHDNRDRDLIEFAEMQKGVSERLAASKKDDALLREEFRQERKDAHAVQRTIEAGQQKLQRTLRPYATRITAML